MTEPDHSTDRSAPTETHNAPYIRRVLIAVGITLLSVALALLLWYGVRVLLVGFAGVLLAVLLRSIADGIAHVTRLSNGWALLVTIVLLVGLFVGMGFLFAPSVTEQANQLARDLPTALDKLRHRLQSTGWGKQALQLWDQANPMQPGAPATQAAQKAGGMIGRTLSGLLDLLIILFLGVYLAAQPKMYVDGLASLAPPARRARACEVLGRCGCVLRWWLIAQAIDMVIIGAATAIGLWVLGVPLALVLGLLAALFNFIPNFGPLISYVPAVLMATVDDPTKAIHVTVLYIVLQSLEGYILLPLLQRNAVDTPPALLIASQVLLTLLVGGIGLALAAPLTACALVIVKMLYLHDTLGDPIELPGHTEPPRAGGPAL